MAEKILSIKINADTKGFADNIAVVIDKLKSVGDSAMKLKADTSLSSILDKEKVQLYGQLQKSFDNINKSKLDEINKQKSLNSLVQQYNQTIRQIADKQNELKGISLGKNLGIGQIQEKAIESVKPYSGFSLGLSKSFEQVKAEEQAAIKAAEVRQNLAKNEVDFAEAERKRELASLKKQIEDTLRLEEERANRLREVNRARIQNEFDFAEAARKRELAALRKHIEDTYRLEDEKAARIEAARKRADSRGYVAQVTAAAPMSFAGGATAQQIKTPSAFTSGGAIGKAAQETRQYIGVADARAKADKQAAKAAKEVDDATKKLERSNRSLIQSVIESTIYYKAFTGTLSLVQKLLTNIPEAGIRMQQAEASATAIFGTAGGMRNIEEVKKLAQEAGQSFLSLQEAYSRFVPSAVLAGAKQSEVNEVFRDFTKVGTVLHQSESQIKSVYLALEQMYAKGTVQSEEIKKQLGNVLPGAVEIGAKAWAQYTTSADKSISGFMDAMKKNEVIAKDFIPRFSKLYAQMFGGVDDSVFNSVRDKYLSNLTRMKNDFEFLSQDLFKASEESLNAFVKTVATGLEDIRENLTGILQVAGLVAGGLAAAFALGTRSVRDTATGAKVLQTNIAAMLGTLPRVRAFLGGLFNPYVIGVEAAIVATSQLTKDNETFFLSYSKFRGASKSVIEQLQKDYAAGSEAAGKELQKIKLLQENSRSFLLNIQGEQVEFSTVISKIWDDIINSITNDWREFSSYMGQMWDGIREQFNNWGNTLSDILTDIENKILKIMAGIRALPAAAAEGVNSLAQLDFSGFGTRVSSAFTDSYERGLSNLTNNLISVEQQSQKTANTISNSFVGATKQLAGPAIDNIDNYFKEIAAYQAKKDKEKRAGLNILESNITDADETAAENRKALSDKQAKSRQAALEKGLREESQSIAKWTSLSLEELETRYDRNLISFQEYYDKRAAIIDEAIARESLLNRGPDTQQRISDLQRQKESDKQARYRADIENLNVINSLNKDFYSVIGDEEAKLKIEQAERYDRILQALDNQINYGRKDLVVIKDRVLATKELEAATLRYTQSKSKADADIEKSQDELNRINILKNIGSVSELGAMRMTDKVNKDIIASLQKKYEIEKEQFDLLEEQAGVPYDAYMRQKDAVEKAKKAVEDFTLTGETVALFFEKTFTDAFENAFSGFITGSMNAQEAFASFAQSILGSMAKLAANELATSILGSFKGAGLGATVLSSIGSFLPFADGGVASGLKSGGGKILTSPTFYPNAKVIPFASGGVLAGEAGAEAVLPLQRGRDGKLGVKSDGQTAGNVYNIAVTVQGDKKESPEKLGERVAEAMMRSIAKEEISKSSRVGNSLNKVNRIR